MQDQYRLNGVSQAIGIGLCVAIAIAAALGYLYWFGPFKPGECGQFGDFLGGVMNPAIGTVTLCALVWTVKAQSETLRLTRLSLEHAQNEANAEAARNLARRVEENEQRERAAAIDNYFNMALRLEKVLARPMFRFGSSLFSLQDVLEGVTTLGVTSEWAKTPRDKWSGKHTFYGEDLAIKLGLGCVDIRGDNTAPTC